MLLKAISILTVALLFTIHCQAQPGMAPEEVNSYALLEQINLYRQSNGLNRLQMDPLLVNIAEKHSLFMSRQHQLSHDHFDDRFRQAQSTLCVENVGRNHDLPQQQFEGWRQSSGHNRNMLIRDLNRAGIAETGKYITFFACK